MEKYTYGASEGEKRIPGHARNRMGMVWMMLVIIIVIVLYDFSDFRGKKGIDLLDSQKHQEKVTRKERGSFFQEEQSNQGRDIVVTEKDLQKAYKDLLNKKENEIENTIMFEAENNRLYLIDLVNGKALTAVSIQLDKKTALITDDQGMTISISREEIVGIKQVDGRGNIRKKK